jgi:hypothetical protein
VGVRTQSILGEDAMHSFLRKRNVAGLLLLALALGALTPVVAAAKPRPGASRGFRLFARSLGALTVNRIYCGLSATGEVCVDSTNSSTIGGGFWPKGTADQYIFNSGMQMAGTVAADAGFAWAGDTTGLFFFDPKGTTQHGEQVEPIFNTTNPDDALLISDTTSACTLDCLAAKVPSADANALLFNPLLRGRTSASQGDVWWLTWDGNPNQNAGRKHPLGILVEQRGMAWNFPTGNEDIVYFIYTFYNVTARSTSGVYEAVRPGMRDILKRQGDIFQDRNEAAFGVDIPDGGYKLENLFAAFSMDADVSEATVDYSSVNVPYALGYVYEHKFEGSTGWTFDPRIFSAPFFPGAGFIGVKYLKSPVDPTTGQQVGLSLFSNTINGGAFDDAQTTIQLYRYLSNNISTAAGDAACNVGDPHVTHICYVNTGSPDDMRFFQSSGPLTLGPGEFQSIVVAYINAAPVATGSCPAAGTCDLTPGDPTRLESNTALNVGANPVDSVTGFLKFTGDANANGHPDQTEITAKPGSLMGKALTAQAVFDAGFLLPFAPDAPDFFTVPGDNSVTVLWKPSVSETTGDPFFALAQQPTVIDTSTGLPVPNALYDPNYRQLDVEGYRVYRGRVDNPNQLQLLVQFDYAGTVIKDFAGQVNPSPGCAPELGINTFTTAPSDTNPLVIDTTFACPVTFDPVTPGVARNVEVDVPLVGQMVQVKLTGGRTALADGSSIFLSTDTAFSGGGAGLPDLRDSGVPFFFVDNTARNNLRYFYSVTAFDFNSFQSGPSSLESPRNTKPVTPQHYAGNFTSTSILSQGITGRGVKVSNDSLLPTLDPATGKFSGKMPPANNVTIGFVGQFLTNLFSGSGSFSAKLVGLGLGDARNGVPASFTYSVTSADGTTLPDPVTLLLAQPLDTSNVTAATLPFPAAKVDPARTAIYGFDTTLVQSGQMTQGIVAYQFHGAWGRGCFVDASSVFFSPPAGTSGCAYNGPRWFQGDNETKSDPNAGNVAGTGAATDLNNAGELPGVLTIQNPQGYTQISGGFRTVESVIAGAVRAADFKVYWGTGGLVDSVIDVTDNVPVPFLPDSLGAGWGFLNQSNTTGPGSGDARPDVLTLDDFGCVFPLNEPTARAIDDFFGCGAGGGHYTLSNTAVPGAIAIYGAGDGTTAVQNPNPGFAMYLSGHIYMFELAPGASVPAAGTVWTNRSYIGAVFGGNGSAGSEGPYTFVSKPRTFNAVGAEATLDFTATNALAVATKNDLSHVHTVPDPYYVTNQFEQTTDTKVIKFVNLPNDCIIRIYSSSGVLVSLLEHHTSMFGGAEDWNVRNRNNQVVASGVYFYHVEAGDARRVGRFTVVNFAE